MTLLATNVLSLLNHMTRAYYRESIGIDFFLFPLIRSFFTGGKKYQTVDDFAIYFHLKFLRRKIAWGLRSWHSCKNKAKFKCRYLDNTIDFLLYTALLQKIVSFHQMWLSAVKSCLWSQKIQFWTRCVIQKRCYLKTWYFLTYATTIDFIFTLGK